MIVLGGYLRESSHQRSARTLFPNTNINLIAKRASKGNITSASYTYLLSKAHLHSTTQETIIIRVSDISYNPKTRSNIRATRARQDHNNSEACLTRSMLTGASVLFSGYMPLIPKVKSIVRFPQRPPQQIIYTHLSRKQRGKNLPVIYTEYFQPWT
jgi:hypothetical protein